MLVSAIYACRLFHTNSEATFTTVGFKDWKYALGKRGVLSLHSSTKTHIEAMLNWKEYQKRVQMDKSVGIQVESLRRIKIYLCSTISQTQLATI